MKTTKTTRKTVPSPAYHVVRSQGSGAITRLAQHLGKSPATVSMTLRKGRPHFNAQFLYTDAINELFGTNHSREFLFAIDK